MSTKPPPLRTYYARTTLETHRRLKKLAVERETFLADLVEQAIEEFLDRASTPAEICFIKANPDPCSRGRG